MEYILNNANDIDNDEENISFSVQELTGVTFQIVDFSPRCTVYMLKTQLATMSTAYLTEDNFRLIFRGVVLEHDRDLRSYDIIDGTRMHMIRRNRGGARTRRTTILAIPYLSTETSSDEDSDEDSV